MPRPSFIAQAPDWQTQFMLATDFFNAGFYWEAHELWEQVWRQTHKSIDATFLKALIQFSAAMVHDRLNRPDSTKRLAMRALGNLSKVAEVRAWPLGLDVCRWIIKWWQIAHAPDSLPAGKGPVLWIERQRVMGAKLTGLVKTGW